MLSTGLQLLPQTQNAIQKYGIDDDLFNSKWRKEKNYLYIVDLFTELAKNKSTITSEQVVLQDKLATLLDPQDVTKIYKLVKSIETGCLLCKTSPGGSYDENDDKEITTIKNIPELYFFVKNPLTIKISVPRKWLQEKNAYIISTLSSLLEQDYHINFGDLSPEMLATKTTLHENYTEYLDHEAVPDWWEKAYFSCRSAGICREDLISLLKAHLISSGLPENQYDDFIYACKKYQLASLLYKDPYYLGWLNPCAGDFILKDRKDLITLVNNPSMIRSLTITTQYGFTDSPSKICIGLRRLVLGDIKAELPTLARFIHLEDLIIGNLAKQKSLQKLPVMPKLKALTVTNGILGQKDLEMICQQPELEVLQLKDCKLTNNIGLYQLLKLPNLKTLSLPAYVLFSDELAVQDTLNLLISKGVDIDFGSHKASELKSLAPGEKFGHRNQKTMPAWWLKTYSAKEIAQRLESYLINEAITKENCASYATVGARYNMPSLLYAACFYAKAISTTPYRHQKTIIALLDHLTGDKGKFKELPDLTVCLLRCMDYKNFGSFLFCKTSALCRELRDSKIFKKLNALRGDQAICGKSDLIEIQTTNGRCKIELDGTLAALSSGYLLEEMIRQKHELPHTLTVTCSASALALRFIGYLLVEGGLGPSIWTYLKNNPKDFDNFCHSFQSCETDSVSQDSTSDDETQPELYAFIAEVWELANALRIEDLKNGINTFLLTNQITSLSDLKNLSSAFPTLTHLSIAIPDLTAEALSVLEQFSYLKKLSFSRIQKINQASFLQSLSKFPGLKSFSLKRCETVPSLTKILSTLQANCKQLNTLSLHHYAEKYRESIVNVEHCKLLASMKNLEYIDLRECVIEKEIDLQKLQKTLPHFIGFKL